MLVRKIYGSSSVQIKAVADSGTYRSEIMSDFPKFFFEVIPYKKRKFKHKFSYTQRPNFFHNLLEYQTCELHVSEGLQIDITRPAYLFIAFHFLQWCQMDLPTYLIFILKKRIQMWSHAFGARSKQFLKGLH